MLNVIIVDDEKSGRETLKIILESYFSHLIKVSAVVSNTNDAFKAILSNNVKIVFLDAQMPNESRLSLLEKFDCIDFEVVVTTAHRAYGIEALKLGIFDYLLKPIDIDDLEDVINKIFEKLNVINPNG